MALLSGWHELSSYEESAPLNSGTAVHVALAHYLDGVSRENCLSIFDDQYRTWSIDNVLETDRLSFGNVYQILDYWLEMNPLSDWAFEPVPGTIERPLSAPLCQIGDVQVMYVGMLDALVRDRRNGQLCVLDHKTTGTINQPWINKFQLASQFSGYLWLARQTFPGEAVNACYVNGIELSKVPTSNRKCVKHGVLYEECGILHPNHTILGPITRSDDQIRAWYDTACKLAKHFVNLAAWFPELTDVGQLHQQGTFNNSCGFCSFQTFCRMDRPVDRIDSLLVHHPWRSLLELKVKGEL